MIHKNSFFIICLIIFLFSIASVCAGDVNDAALTNDDCELYEISNSDDGVLSENNVLAENSKTFTDLRDLIRNSSGEDIFLDSDYAFNEETDSNLKNGVYISKSVNIYGNGFTLDGKNKARIFDLNTNCEYLLKDINFINGNSTSYGGAINYYDPPGHSCIVINCTFTDNYAVSYGGAAVYINAINCTFLNNSAGEIGGALYYGTACSSVFINNTARNGGAVGYVDVDGCLFEYNSAENAGAMFDGVATNSTFNHNSAIYYGGAVSNGEVSTDCKFANNTANNIDNNVSQTVTFFENYKSLTALNQTINGNALTEIYLNENYAYNRALDWYYNKNGINIGRSLTIYGNGFEIDDKIVANIFNITKGVVTLKDLIFKNGTILGYCSNLNVINCTFVGSKLRTNGNCAALNCNFINESGMSYGTATECSFTGASFMQYGSAINSVFHDNEFDYGIGSFSSGSAVNCTFINNRADYGAAMYDSYAENCTFINNNAEYGGAMNYNCRAVNCTFIGNSAVDGGAMYDGGSAVNCTFINNSAENGGAINQVNVIGSTFINNHASELGGAIYESYVSDSIFEGNSAKSGGAVNGNLVINCTFDNNLATEYGGAVCNARVSTDSKFNNNVATYGNDTYNVTFFEKTVGKTFKELNETINANSNSEIYLDSNYVFDYMTDSDFTNGITINRPVTVYGNSFILDGSSSARIFNVNSEDVVFRDIIFVNGQSTVGSAINGESSAINCVFKYNSAGNNGGATRNVNAVNCTFISNSAGLYGGAMTAGDADNCTFIDNSATFGGAMNSGVAENSVFANNSAELGGATYRSSAVNCNFTGNHAGSGGAMATDSSNMRYAINCIFVNNTAELDGGALIYSTANGCTFINNSADRDGGALWNSNAYYSDFISNSASGNGGAMCGNEHFACDCAFINNSATNGGAIYKINAGYSNFTNNHADADGGAAFQSVVTDSIFEYNSAANGAAMSGVRAVNCTFDFNNATNGAVVENAKVSTDSIFNDNYGDDTSDVTFFNKTVGKTFYELDSLINDNNNEDIYLNDDYAFDIRSDFNYRNGIEINRKVTIHGNGHTIDANQIARIFKVTNNDVTFINVTFINGHANTQVGFYLESGGAISGRSHVINCTFIDNYAQGYGGAVHEVDDVINSTFINNTADSDGGATYKSNAYNCTFIGNQAPNGGAMRGYYEEAFNCYFGFNSGDLGSATYDIDVYNCTFIDKRANTKSDYVYKGTDENCTFIFLPKFYLDTQDFITTYNSNDPFPINLKTIDDVVVEDANTTLAVYNSENILVGTYNCLSGDGWIIDLDAGNYTVNVSVEERYGDAEPVNVTLTINKAQSDAIIDADDIYCGEALTVNVQLPYDATGFVTVNVGTKTKEVNLTEGFGSVDFTDLALGTHNVVVSYDGDNNYLESLVNTTVKVTKATPEITVTADSVVYGDVLVVNVELPSDVTRRAVVTVDNESKYVSLANGIGSVKFSGLAVGTYTVVASYNGDSKYVKASASSSVKVNRATPEIIVSANNIHKGEDLVVNVQFPSDVTRRAVVSVGGESKTVSLTDGVGSVRFSGLAVGTHSICVSYNGDSNYLKASVNATVKVNRGPASIEVTANPVSYGEDVVITVKLPSDVTRRVTVTVGNVSKLVSLTDGVGSVRFSGLAVGTHDVFVSYGGDTNYLKSSANATVKVNKAVPEIQVNANNITSGETLVVEVQLPADVTKRAAVSVDGVLKYASLKNGVGSVKFTGLDVGTHEIVVSYAGDANYKKASVETTIEVKS